MDTISSNDLEGKLIVSQNGREVGEVEGVDVDVKTWKVPTFEVKLRRDVLEELNLKRPLLGSQTVRLSVEHVSGITDTVVLKSSLADLAFIGGRHSEDDEHEKPEKK